MPRKNPTAADLKRVCATVADAAKPCPACPWTQPGRPDITPELLQAARGGAWFCCHGRGGGTCAGAVAEHKRAQAADARSLAAGGCYCNLHPLDCETAGHPVKESV